MKGFVDERDRALMPIRVANKLRSEMAEVVAWIDTAFDGPLMIQSTRWHIEESGSNHVYPAIRIRVLSIRPQSSSLCFVSVANCIFPLGVGLVEKIVPSLVRRSQDVE